MYKSKTGNHNPAVWMQEMATDIHPLLVSDIAMAGVHHPASYSFMSGNTGKFITTPHNIYQQLMSGIRYFDSRPNCHQDNGIKQIVEYHGNSYGASYNTLLRSFGDFFKGYDTLSAYGEAPALISLDDGTFVMLYHSKRLVCSNQKQEKKENKVFVTKLFYRIAHYCQSNRQLEWSEEQAYNYGMTPDAIVTQSNKIVEVHKSQNKNELWYTLGEINQGMGMPTFNLRFQGSYTTGVQPSVGLLLEDGKETLLEVHKSENNDQLWFMCFTINGDTLESLDPENKDSENNNSKEIPDCYGLSHKLVTLPGTNKNVLFYSNKNESLCYRVACIVGRKIDFSEERLITNLKGRHVSACLMGKNNDIALSYTQTINNKEVRSYIHLEADDGLQQWHPGEPTVFGDSYPTWNALSAALYSPCDNVLLSLESDVDALNNIWYQPLTHDQSGFKLADILSRETERKEEFVVISLTENKLNQSAFDQLSDIVEYFLGDKIITNDKDNKIDIKKDALVNILARGKQGILYFDNSSGKEGCKNLNLGTNIWPMKGNLSRPWHKQKELNGEYFSTIFNLIENRCTTHSDEIFVLQTHLTSNDKYNTVLDWNKQYTPVANSYLLSQESVLSNNKVNIIESDRPIPFLVDYCCYLNGLKGSFAN